MRLKFKRGNNELELEFQGDVPEAQRELVSSLLTAFGSLLAEEDEQLPPPQRTSTPGRRSTRGGRRTAFVSPAIDRLIESKWLVQKNVSQIVERLRTDGVAGASEDNVVAALSRKYPHKLTRIQKDNETVWTIHTTQ